MIYIPRKLVEVFEKEYPQTILRENFHEYLGITLEYFIPGKFQNHMIDYINSMIDDTPEHINIEAVTPSSNQLASTNNKPMLLLEYIGKFTTATLQIYYLYVSVPGQIYCCINQYMSK